MNDRSTHTALTPLAVAALVACGTTLDDGVQFGSGDSGSANATASEGADDGSPSAGSTADDTASADDTMGATDTGGVKYDVGAGTESGGAGQCDCGSQLGFSYIWVAISG